MVDKGNPKESEMTPQLKEKTSIKDLITLPVSSTSSTQTLQNLSSNSECRAI